MHVTARIRTPQAAEAQSTAGGDASGCDCPAYRGRRCSAVATRRFAMPAGDYRQCLLSLAPMGPIDASGLATSGNY